MTIDWKDIVGNVLLFFLVFGMSATVDTSSLRTQLKNTRALFTGMFLQFVILPLLGFMMVKLLKLNDAIGITLLIVTSSPGGSYSNWWCSLFNADLALSVTMTAISTLMGVFMMPANLLLYARLSYEGNILELLNWWSLFAALAIVIGAITLGLTASSYYNSKYFHVGCNQLGNLSGIALVVFSAVLCNSNKDAQLWDRDWKFYFGVAAPCIFSLIISNVFTTFLKIKPPERITVSIECCYQNVGIATSIALTMFEGDELAEALGVPFFYGVVEAVSVGIYCLVAWKIGWSKAPRDVSLWKTLTTSYEVLVLDEDKDMVIVTKNDVEMPQTAHAETQDDDEDFHYVKMSENTEEKTNAEKVDDEDFDYVEHSDAELNADAEQVTADAELKGQVKADV